MIEVAKLTNRSLGRSGEEHSFQAKSPPGTAQRAESRTTMGTL